jgi:2-C-methyl-D-erythritol 4-phosphate cytidylyltransferase
MVCAALVTAGGTGRRMGTPTAKQYLDLGGMPLLARTLAVFQNHPLIAWIVLTVPAGDEELCRSRVVLPFGLDKVKEIIAGGSTRQASVYNGLKKVASAQLVAIHDGVRPLVSPEVITRTIAAAQASGAAVACAPVRDTVKKRAGSYLETLPRSDLWLAHTPQTFKTGLILEAHKKAVEDGFVGTDDSILVERLGHPVSIVVDSEDNLKITTLDDLERARLLLKYPVGYEQG